MLLPEYKMYMFDARLNLLVSLHMLKYYTDQPLVALNE